MTTVPLPKVMEVPFVNPALETWFANSFPEVANPQYAKSPAQKLKMVDLEGFEFFLYKSCKDQVVQASVSCPNIDKIWQCIGEHFKAQHFPWTSVQFGKNSKWDNKECVIISVSRKDLVNYSEKSKLQIKDAEKKISSKFAALGRHIIGSIYEVYIDAFRRSCLGEAIKLPCFDFRTSAGHTWVAYRPKELTIFIGMNCEDKLQRDLAKKILCEFVDSIKERGQSKKPVTFKLIEAQIPELLAQLFPIVKGETFTFNVGIVSITLSDKDNIALPHHFASYLSGLRGYIYFHVHALKMQLRSKLNVQFIQKIQKDLFKIQLNEGRNI